MQTPPPPDTLDTTTLVDLEDIMGDELATLVDAYLRDGDTRMRNLRVAAELGDAAEVGKLAHSLKSSSANLGAMSLSNAAKKLELATRTQTLERPAVAVALIANEFARARQALRANMSQNA